MLRGTLVYRRMMRIPSLKKKIIELFQYVMLATVVEVNIYKVFVFSRTKYARNLERLDAKILIVKTDSGKEIQKCL